MKTLNFRLLNDEQNTQNKVYAEVISTVAHKLGYTASLNIQVNRMTHKKYNSDALNLKRFNIIWDYADVRDLKTNKIKNELVLNLEVLNSKQSLDESAKDNLMRLVVETVLSVGRQFQTEANLDVTISKRQLVTTVDSGAVDSFKTEFNKVMKPFGITAEKKNKSSRKLQVLKADDSFEVILEKLGIDTVNPMGEVVANPPQPQTETDAVKYITVKCDDTKHKDCKLSIKNVATDIQSINTAIESLNAIGHSFETIK